MKNILVEVKTCFEYMKASRIFVIELIEGVLKSTMSAFIQWNVVADKVVLS